MAQWGQAPLRPRTYSDACPRDYHYFDAKANPVFSLAYDWKEMQFLSDKEFEDYLVKATRYKAGLLRIATLEMLAMKERRTSN